MAEVFLRRLTRWQAEQQREAVAGVYAESYWDRDREDRLEFLRRFEHEVRRPDFDMVAADASGLVGFLYGARAERDGSCWEGFCGVLPREIRELTAAGRVFVLSGLMVVPRHRRAGVATRLRTLFLTRHATDLVVMVIPRDDAVGREVLRAWGWSKLGDFAAGGEGWVRSPEPVVAGSR